MAWNIPYPYRGISNMPCGIFADRLLSLICGFNRELFIGGGIYAYGARNRPEAVRATPLSQPEK